MKLYGETYNLKDGIHRMCSVIVVSLSPSFRQYSITLFLLLFVQFIALGLTYTTIKDGAWNSPAVWSTNGETGCQCAPSARIAGFDVVLNHSITMTSRIFLKSENLLTLNNTSELIGDFDLFIANGELISSGTIISRKLIVLQKGKVTFNGPITTSSNFIIGGTATFNSEITVNDFNFITGEESVMCFSPNATITMQNGNLSNSGRIEVDSACIQMSGGNFDNLETGTVTGTGSITVTDGSITNKGVWSLDVDWCASGPTSGLPGEEKCVNTFCTGPSPLPIELIFFKCELIEGIVILKWQTLTESNNDFYTMERCVKGLGDFVPSRWQEIEIISGAGNSNTVRNYTFVDELSSLYFLPLTLYYRLKQTDYDGTYELSDVVVVKVPLKVDVSVYPNPVPGQFILSMYLEEAQDVQLEVFDLKGNSIYLEELVLSSGNLLRQIDLSGHAKGVYNLKVTTAVAGTINRPIVVY